MVYLIKIFLYLLFYSITIAFPQINFHRTDHFNYEQSHVALEYDCLHVSVPKVNNQNIQEILSLCLTESLSKWNIQTNSTDQKLTFDELRKQNITGEQLYQWSASIDLIEQYEHYLTSNQSSVSNDVFYNCTALRFGPQCQYEFLYLPSENITLNKIILEFYQMEYEPTSLTCYTHLECDRGSKSMCLDWTEICDGSVHCVGDQIDEKFCWELLIYECREDEYRCANGQCISKRFAFDHKYIFECLDRSDELESRFSPTPADPNTPTLNFEDGVCQILYVENKISPRISPACDTTRLGLLGKFRVNDKPNTLSNICQFVFLCARSIQQIFPRLCQDICNHNRCTPIINETCPELSMYPASPIAFGHVYAGYLRAKDDYSFELHPEYICYDEKLCRGFQSNVTLMKYNNKTCRRTEDTSIQFYSSRHDRSFITILVSSIHDQLQHCNTILYDNLNICNSSLMYRCQNSSKCIYIYRLCNGIIDCDYGDDENCLLVNGICSPIESDVLFKCPLTKKCISRSRSGNGICDCPTDQEDFCEDEMYSLCDPYNLHLCNDWDKTTYARTVISFPTICDGFQELFPILIDGTNHTDETDCQYWKCNNSYTRCNGYWNCLDGADEVGCDEHPSMNCPSEHHICIEPKTFELMCLPLSKANNGHIDCLGATDEPKICRSESYTGNRGNFRCDSISKTACDNLYYVCSSSCINENADLFCNLSKKLGEENYCSEANNLSSPYLVQYLCLRPSDHEKEKLVDFSLVQTVNEELEKEQAIEEPSVIGKSFRYDFECHRGYPLRLWSNYNQSSSHIICLCLPNYYGEYCQYQNQRVSLTFNFETYSDARRTLFSLVVLLIDNSTQRTIHSFKQITYIYTQHCRTKFNFYLTYSTRPKDSNKTYSIHIDIYEKSSFGYRGSIYIPLHFPFLPVHRIAYALNIPRNNKSIVVKCPKDQPCINGLCMKYAENSSDLKFCHCHKGWSGKDCSISYNCTCSSDSLCNGIQANNRSICICPSNRWGPRCYLRNTICQLNGTPPCLNNGQCVVIDESMGTSEKEFFCICQKGFSGDRCEIEDAKIIVSFDKSITLSDNMLVHFIQIQKDGPIKNGSTFQSIPLYQRDITIRWPRPFHIAFTELSDKTYYLINVEKDYNQSRVIRKLITSSDRCGRMSEYFNQTVLDYPLIRRIKYYHLPCKNQISCFYDQDHFCLCNDFGSERVANCFEFNSTLLHGCFKLSNCENGGQCLQDDVHCPHTSRCLCRPCSYGSLCQFSSSLFDLSLDGIIGSHIQPNVSVHHQPSIVKTTFGLIIVMFVVGFIDGILSCIAFRSKETRQVGCGYYLFGSAITTLFTLMMLTLKFTILLLVQISTITNRTFLTNQCYAFDYMLQICLNMDRWLNGCVAMERALNIIKGTKFNKNKSKRAAKYMIGFLILMTTASTIYDPLHRRLVEDESNDEQKRLWCIVSYSPGLLYFNQFIHMFHFFVPFLMNIVSSSIIIFLSTKRQQTIHKDKTYCQTLYGEIQQHRHLLVAPFVLVILSLPRLIISFVGGCMQSNSNPWLYLIGYLISFIPPMLTFVLFVLPSKLYKDEFRKTLKQYRKTIRGQMSRIR